MVNFKNILKDLPESTCIQAPIFESYIMPHGFLTPDPIEHALFYYYVNARQTYETYVLDTPIVMEGDVDPEFNFRQLLTSIAALYNVAPEDMVKAWSVIDRQCGALNLPLLPNEYEYRFADSPSIILN